jgi:GAF domain-containing protein
MQAAEIAQILPRTFEWYDCVVPELAMAREPVKKRSKIRATAAKARRPQVAKSSPGTMPKAALRSQSTPSGEDTEVARLTRELAEAREQQSATSKVLQVISRSPGDLEPVFASMLENAVRICDANFGNIYRWHGDALHLAATYKTPPAFAKARSYSFSNRPGPKTVTGRMLASKEVVHVVDTTAEPGYGDKSDPGAVAAVELGGARTILAVPMWKEDELIGSFTVYRREVRPFTGKQIELVQNFSAQAVIAIENARLLRELRERTHQLEAQSQELAKLNQHLEQRVSDQVGEIERMGSCGAFCLRRWLI